MGIAPTLAGFYFLYFKILLLFPNMGNWDKVYLGVYKVQCFKSTFASLRSRSTTLYYAPFHLWVESVNNDRCINAEVIKFKGQATKVEIRFLFYSIYLKCVNVKFLI